MREMNWLSYLVVLVLFGAILAQEYEEFPTEEEKMERILKDYELRRQERLKKRKNNICWYRRCKSGKRSFVSL